MLQQLDTADTADTVRRGGWCLMYFQRWQILSEILLGKERPLDWPQHAHEAEKMDGNQYVMQSECER